MSDEIENNALNAIASNVANTSFHVVGSSSNNTYITNTFINIPLNNEKRIYSLTNEKQNEKSPSNVEKSIDSSNATNFKSFLDKFASTNNLSTDDQPNNIKINDSTTIKNQEEENPNFQTATKEPEDVKERIIPIVRVELTNEENQLILKLIWKHLRGKDKLNCTLVSKNFNNLISKMDCFRLNINLRNNPIDSISKLERNYTVVFFRGSDVYYWDSCMIQMLKHLSRSLVELQLFNVITNLMTLRDLLYALPMLEILSMVEIKFKGTELNLKDLPKFLHLRQLEIIRVNDAETMYPIFSSASCIQTLSLHFNATKLSAKGINTFLFQHKSSIKTLKMNSFAFDLYRSKWDLKIDCLLQLRDLTLFESDNILTQVLTSDCVYSLTDFRVTYRSKKIKKMNFFLQNNYFMAKQINEDHLFKHKAVGFKKPIITRIIYPNTGNIITKYYLVHHCRNNNYSGHSKCKSIPLTNSTSNSIENEDNDCYLFISVRDNMKDFETRIKELFRL